MPVGIHVGMDRTVLDADEDDLLDFAKLCMRTGVTTVTEFGRTVGR